MTPLPIRDQTTAELLDFHSDGFRTDPWPVYRTLRSTEPVYWSAEARAFLLLKHADVADALVDHRLVTDFPMRTSRRLFGPTIMDTDGAKHRQLRRLFTPLFGGGAVRRLHVHLISSVVDQVLDTVDGHDEVDFMRQIAVPVPYGVITRLLGLPPADAEWLRQRVVPLAGAIDFPSVPLETARVAKAELTDYLADLVADWPGGDRPTLVDLLIRHSAQPADPGLLSMVILFLLAGTETSVSTIGTIMHTLLRHGITPAALLDGDFRQAAVWETLRWEPPTHSILRYAAADIEIREVRIPRHSAVLLSLASGNRDDEAFTDPDTWRPGRRERKSLSFGAGPHACLGIHLALAEFDVLFERLATRYVNIRHSGQPARLYGHGFRRPDHLMLRWDPSNHERSNEKL
ncbi:MAG: cytochrome P450 [Pseudonocardiaceae bacterium]